MTTATIVRRSLLVSSPSFIKGLVEDVKRLNANGQFFTVTFMKKNGDMRKMNCRLGVTKHLKGGKSTTDHVPRLMTVYDVKANGYRCINMETVREIKFNGNHIIFK
jgi:hypothetical protein